MDPIRSNSSVLVSVVVPAYNEEGVISETLHRIRRTSESDTRLSGHVEVVIVSDGSEDRTFDEASSALGDGLRGTVIQLAANSGSHAAIRCGLIHANGEYVVVLSADGQDPPELIPDMLNRFEHGIEVVWGKRNRRVNDPWLRRTIAGGYYRLFRKVTALNYPPAGLDFVMFTSTIRDSLVSYRERNTSIFLLLFNLGFGQTSVQYDRGERLGGQSHWTFRKRARLALDMATSFSAAPIRLVSFGGLTIGITGLLFGGYTIVRGMVADLPVSGWASLMVVSSLLGGFTLVAIALIGEYIWRTLDEVRDRPLYFESQRKHIE
jgi:dolichol-phosphate mannosyltransferase